MVNGLPANWSLVSLSEVAYIQMGQSPNSRTYNETGDGLPFFQGKAEFGKIHPTTKRWTTNPIRIAEANDILLSVRAPVGPTNLATGRCCIGRGLASIRADNPLNNKYLFYYFRNIESWLGQQGTGTTFAGINSDLIQNLQVPIAPVNEQQRIANKLDVLLARIDVCLARLERVQLILEQFRQAVLVAATSGDLTADWREEHGISRESWSKEVGAKIFPFITSGSRGWAKYYSDSGALFLRVGDLAHGTIELDLSNVQRVNLPETVEGKRTKVEPGDILISITADIGRIALIDDNNIGEAYINQHLCLARQNGEYSSAYLAYYLASPEGGFAQLSEMQRGMVKAGLKLGDIRDLEFEIPERQEQDEIVRCIRELSALADRIEKSYHTVKIQIERLTPILLDKAFRGELVPQDPQDPNEEPAAVLLEYIKAQRKRETVESKPKAQIERPGRIKMTVDIVKEAINQLPEDTFSFDELREKIPGDYETLKSILFELLTTPEPSVTQFFDQSLRAMRFIRSKK